MRRPVGVFLVAFAAFPVLAGCGNSHSVGVPKGAHVVSVPRGVQRDYERLTIGVMTVGVAEKKAAISVHDGNVGQTRSMTLSLGHQTTLFGYRMTLVKVAKGGRFPTADLAFVAVPGPEHDGAWVPDRHTAANGRDFSALSVMVDQARSGGCELTLFGTSSYQSFNVTEGDSVTAFGYLVRVLKTVPGEGAYVQVSPEAAPSATVSPGPLHS